MFYLRVIPSHLGCGTHTLIFRKCDRDFGFKVIPETKKLLSMYGVGFLSYESAYSFIIRHFLPCPCSIHKTSLDLPFVFERDFLDKE
jgi:hypothetical protein